MVTAKIAFFLRAASYFVIMVASAVAAGSLGQAINDLSVPGYKDVCPLTVRNDRVGSSTECEYVMFTSIATCVLALGLCITAIVNIIRVSTTQLSRAVVAEAVAIVAAFACNLAAGSIVSIERKATCKKSNGNICHGTLGRQLAATEGGIWCVTVTLIVVAVMLIWRARAAIAANRKEPAYVPYANDSAVNEGGSYVPPQAPAN
eukprot:m.103566 g.103566  ORF g.103566 m.103566 type:complete len:204 (-) comp15720_c0_seq2:2046-2657(-)